MILIEMAGKHNKNKVITMNDSKHFTVKGKQKWYTGETVSCEIMRRISLSILIKNTPQGDVRGPLKVIYRPTLERLVSSLEWSLVIQPSGSWQTRDKSRWSISEKVYGPRWRFQLSRTISDYGVPLDRLRGYVDI